MLRWANRRSFFRCGHARASLIKETRLCLDACFQSFATSFASKACSSHDASAMKVSRSKIISNHGDVGFSESKVSRRQHAQASGDATICVCHAGRQDISVLPCSHHDSKGHGDAKGLGSAKKAQKTPLDLQQKVELLESEQFLVSDTAMLVKRRAFKSCSLENLSTVLQVLKETFSSAKVVHNIVVGSPKIVQQPAKLVQQKLKLLYDFQFEEKVVSRICTTGRGLSMSVQLLQQKLMFYEDAGLTVEARNMMFYRSAHLLHYATENIQPTLNFLESTGLTREGIWNLGQYCPEVLVMSLENALIERYQYFRQLGFSDKDFPRVCRGVRRLSIKSIKERMQSLKDIGFSDEDLLKMVKKQPAIISCSPEYMKCKLDFLICEHNRDIAELVNDPVSLLFSLQGRIAPRFNFIKESGNPKDYLLSSILHPSDSLFMKRFGKK